MNEFTKDLEEPLRKMQELCDRILKILIEKADEV